MGSRRRNLFVILFVLGLMIGSGLILASKETSLGLDLSGGTRLIYEAQPSPQNPEIDDDDITRAIEIIRERVDQFGVAEPEIAQVGTDQIQIDLPNVDDADRAAEQVGDTAQLFFYDWEPNVIPLDPEAAGQSRPTEIPIPRLIDAVELAAKQKPECKGCTAGPRYYAFNARTEEPLAGPVDERAQLREDPDVEKLPQKQVEVIEVPKGTLVVEGVPGVTPQDGDYVEGSPPVFFVLRDRPELSGEDIADPQQSTDPRTGQPNVTFDFNGDGAKKFAEVTERIADRGRSQSIPGAPVFDHFAIVLDDRMISRPIIDHEENPNGIDGRTGAQISGSFTIQEAQDLAFLLRAGALPVKLSQISSSQVSATLGQQALDEGLTAGLAGLVLVILFLLLYYRFLGFVAALGLVVYGVFFYALIKLIPITLTLPGIAGLILTIGVAADSNIVIFERIKEEARKGKSMPSAIATGYRKGIATIIDANVITLLTAFILFGLATAGVKGFAFALFVGTIVSLFTAVVFTQAILGTLGRARFLRSPRFLGAGEQKVTWHFDFAGASRWFFSASGAILAIGAISFATAQLNFGIDFESGTKLTAALERVPSGDEAANVEAVRDALKAAGVEEYDGSKIQFTSNEDLGDNVVQIQTQTLDTAGLDAVQKQLDREFGVRADGFDFTTVGPTFGEQIARSAVYAILFSLVLIAAYMAFRFEAKYAIPVMIAVIHDILITAGIYSIADREVTAATVAAFLTILGYSLYDTVIVFDRIRENVPRLPRATFSQIANRSLSEVLTRSLITGLSTVFLITVILVFGGETLQDFAFAMMVGVLSGTYSSIFIGTPVLIAWKEREHSYRTRRARIAEAMGYVPAFPEDNEVARLGDDEVPDEPAPGVAQEPVAVADAVMAPEEDLGTPAPAAAAMSSSDIADAEERARRREEKRRRREQRRKQSRKHGRNR